MNELLASPRERVTMDGANGLCVLPAPLVGRRVSERAARQCLRDQIERLERELSSIVAASFPHIACAGGVDEDCGGPRLLTLDDLEQLRDRLAIRVHEVREQAAERSEFERQSRDLLERMKREPRRYKFMRLPVVDLGQRGCGAWEVRPRLGVIGMLAGWWQVKLSSGCPLARGRALCAARRTVTAGAREVLSAPFGVSRSRSRCVNGPSRAAARRSSHRRHSGAPDVLRIRAVTLLQMCSPSW